LIDFKCNLCRYAERVYACPLGDACTTGVDVADADTWTNAAPTWRNATGPESVLDMSLCAAGYTEGAVFCGGASVPKCDRYFVKDQGTSLCVQCPSKGTTLARFLGVTAVGIVLVLLMGRLLYRAFSAKPLNDPYAEEDIAEGDASSVAYAVGPSRSSAVFPADFAPRRSLITPNITDEERRGMEQELRDAKKSRGVINILTGWVQVMGQMTTMVDVSIIPGSFTAVTGRVVCSFE
jgi:hypothetical protein